MKIKNWNKFGKLNESSETFTYEMAQEIVYFMSGFDAFTDEVFWQESLDTIVLIEDELFEPQTYSEFKKATIDMQSLAKGREVDFINFYNKIREKRAVFPKIYEIEDFYLNLIEANLFDFILKTSDIKYEITLAKDYKNVRKIQMSEYIEYCQVINHSLQKFSAYRVTLKRCEMACDLSSHIIFEIEIRPNYGK